MIKYFLLAFVLLTSLCFAAPAPKSTQTEQVTYCYGEHFSINNTSMPVGNPNVRFVAAAAGGLGLGYLLGKGIITEWVFAPLAVLACVMTTGHGPCGTYWTSCPCLMKQVMMTTFILTSTVVALIASFKFS